MVDWMWPLVATYTVGVVAFLVHLHAPDKGIIKEQEAMLELIKAKVDSHTALLHDLEEGEDELESKLNRFHETLTRLENRLNNEAQPTRTIPWPPGLK